VLRLLTPCTLLADVGTDHALIPLAAVQRGLAERAIAADLREAPLRVARRNLERAALQHEVSLVQGDGLAALAGRGVDAVIMAGLSGRSMQHLCDAAPEVLSGVTQLVLQPNQNLDTLRSWALAKGWHLRDEAMIEERGRTFVSCAFVPGVGRDPVYESFGASLDLPCKVGPLLLARKEPLARNWCKAQRERLEALHGARDEQREAELSLWRAACELMR
jgi:tRNA (adenine22-N1)-methyltransferase